jgi:hypothetical protein
MKEIDLTKMSNINGGGFWDGFCAGAALSFIFAPNPVSGAVTFGCILYEMSTW